jgi:hypothetical protein
MEEVPFTVRDFTGANKNYGKPLLLKYSKEANEHIASLKAIIESHNAVATVIVDDHQEEEVPCTGGYRPEWLSIILVSKTLV